MKKLLNNLPFRLLLGVVIGILAGQAANLPVMHVIVTAKFILGQIITFCVPLIIIGFTQIFSSAVTRKGWQCVAGYSVTMPNTYVSLPGFDVDDKDIETQKVQNAVARVRFINEEITSRAQMKQYNCHEGALPFTKSYLLRPLFNAFLMSPKPFHATEACIGCKKCEKVCPVGNITVTDRPVWGGNCTQCLACYHVCPVHAVEYGKMTGKKGQYKGRLLKDL